MPSSPDAQRLADLIAGLAAVGIEVEAAGPGTMGDRARWAVKAAWDRAFNEGVEAAAKVCEDEALAPDGPGRIFRALDRIRNLKRTP